MMILSLLAAALVIYLIFTFIQSRSSNRKEPKIQHLNDQSTEEAKQTSKDIIFDDSSIQIAVNDWLDNKSNAIEKYGHISVWNVSRVTNMDRLFSLDNNEERREAIREFNENLSAWDVSNVTSMKGMFASALAFNQPLSNWNLSKVKDISEMFFGAKSFSQKIFAWDVSSVTNMYQTFSWAESFNDNIGGWNVSEVTNMYRLFGDSAFNQDIGYWNVSKVNNFDGMFDQSFKKSAVFEQDLSRWSLDGVKDHKVKTTLEYLNKFSTRMLEKELPPREKDKKIRVKICRRDDGDTDDTIVLTTTLWNFENVIGGEDLDQFKCSDNEVDFEYTEHYGSPIDLVMEMKCEEKLFVVAKFFVEIESTTGRVPGKLLWFDFYKCDFPENIKDNYAIRNSSIYYINDDPIANPEIFGDAEEDISSDGYILHKYEDVNFKELIDSGEPI